MLVVINGTDKYKTRAYSINLNTEGLFANTIQGLLLQEFKALDPPPINMSNYKIVGSSNSKQLSGCHQLLICFHWTFDWLQLNSRVLFKAFFVFSKTTRAFLRFKIQGQSLIQSQHQNRPVWSPLTTLGKETSCTYLLWTTNEWRFLYILVKKASDLLRVAVNCMEHPRECQAEDSADKECWENGFFLPLYV